MSYAVADRPLWVPSPDRVAGANITAFSREQSGAGGGPCPIMRRCMPGRSMSRPSSGLRSGSMATCGARWAPAFSKAPGACRATRWFPDAHLNFAENLLRSRDDSDALVFWGEDRVKNRLSHGDLYRQVAHFAAALQEMGVVAGDRVAAWMPNLPETIVVMLAASSIGAIFSSASPDFGVQGVLDRFGQIEPKVLVAVDGYYYNGKVVDCLDRLAAITDGLPSVKRVVVVPYVHAHHDLSHVHHARDAGQISSSLSWRSPRFPLSGCLSSIPCSSCIRRAPPGCPSASSIVPAGPCSSTSRSIVCTVT
jgi:acetoacetyl-CoA synthetase